MWENGKTRYFLQLRRKASRACPEVGIRLPMLHSTKKWHIPCRVSSLQMKCQFGTQPDYYRCVDLINQHGSDNHARCNWNLYGSYRCEGLQGTFAEREAITLVHRAQTREGEC